MHSIVMVRVYSLYFQENAQNSPEHGMSADGQYSVGLLYGSEIVSDEKDSRLCPVY